MGIYKTEIYDLIHKKLMDAIEQKIPVIITSKGKGVNSSFYEDKVGIYSVIELYMKNYADIDGKMGLSIKNEKTNNSVGAMFLNFNTITSASISYHYERVLIKLEDIEFNFINAFQ